MGFVDFDFSCGIIINTFQKKQKHLTQMLY